MNNIHYIVKSVRSGQVGSEGSNSSGASRAAVKERPLIENSKAPGKYVKHTPEQLELLLGNLFEGKQERA
nr:unnamed protein product [Digitaria exilis]